MKNYTESDFVKGVARLIEENFKTPSDFAVQSMKKVFKLDEDSRIYKMNKGEIPEVVEVYWKERYLCDLIETMGHDEVLHVISYNIQSML